MSSALLTLVLFSALCLQSLAWTPNYNWTVWPLPAVYNFSGDSMGLSVGGSERSHYLRLRICLRSARRARVPFFRSRFRGIGSGRSLRIRYRGFIGTGTASGSFSLLEIEVGSPDESLNRTTSYNYTLTVSSSSGLLKASTVYGAMYGLETFSQLILNGNFNYSSVVISDSPTYTHRGVMLDTGRRFYPVPTVMSILDGMFYSKMNVLHWHLSDWCRVSVESKRYPQLTEYLKGELEGYYTQEEVKGVVDYARSLGIRIIPEFDIPGHSLGFSPLSAVGMQFCDDRKFQLYGDPENKTFSVLKNFLEEILPLFPDEFVHFGCDELDNSGRCDVASFTKLERQIFEYVHSIGKRPISWEEALYSTGAAYEYNVVNAWQHHTASETIRKGYDSVESAEPHFYLDHVDSNTLWFNISSYGNSNGLRSIKSVGNALGTIFGGEVSMWTDNYCYIRQCGSASGAKPIAHDLFVPARNKEFDESIQSLIFPRAIKAAGSFWHFDPWYGEKTEDFLLYIRAHNDRIRARGVKTCPNGCRCDELSKCGQKYIQ